MKHLTKALAAVAVAVVAGAGGIMAADGPLNRLTPEEESAGWILLFDGKTLNGWEDPSRETPPGDAWVVKNGCIKAVGRPRIREDLLTLETFENFELSFEWRISPEGNSGVKYRVQDRALIQLGKRNPDARRFEDLVDYELRNRLSARSSVSAKTQPEEYLVAFEYQVIDNDGHRDARRGPLYQAGAIYGMIPAEGGQPRPGGEFNQSRIVLRGNHVEHWLNGVKVVDTELDAAPIVEGLEKRWGKESPVYRLLTEQPKKSTPVALQHHVDEAWYRNIKIRRLP